MNIRNLFPFLTEPSPLTRAIPPPRSTEHVPTSRTLTGSSSCSTPRLLPRVASTRWSSRPAHGTRENLPPDKKKTGRSRAKPPVIACLDCHRLLANPCACSTSSAPNRGRRGGHQHSTPLDGLSGNSPNPLCGRDYLNHSASILGSSPFLR
jgi:hypothetical protein